MKQYTVAIIGCGSIGALKPDNIDGPLSENILTHAHAVYAHPETNLMYVIDNDIEKAKQAAEKWQAFYRTDLKFDIIPDIIIVSVPTNHHYQILSKLSEYKPGLIIIEKPFCQNLNELQRSLWGNKAPVLVNYTRRFVPGIINLKKKLDEDHVLNCRVLYTRGFHDGCHAIDLMNYFFGECISARRIRPSKIVDRDVNDPTISIAMNYEKCDSVIFQPCDGREYGIFEIDICCRKNRYRLIDNSLYIERYPIIDENEWGHKALGYSLTSVIRQETGLNTALYNLISNAVAFLNKKVELLCLPEDAIKVHDIMKEIKEN